MEGKVSGDLSGTFQDTMKWKGLILSLDEFFLLGPCLLLLFILPSLVDWFDYGADYRSPDFRVVKGLLRDWAGIFCLALPGAVQATAACVPGTRR